jgi:hypothetical protein
MIGLAFPKESEECDSVIHFPTRISINMVPVNSLIAHVTNNPIRDILSNVHWHGAWNFHDPLGVIIIIPVVSAWITGVRMRIKIRKDLGRKATEADLTSIDTWMKVDETEQRNKRNSPLKPD